MRSVNLHLAFILGIIRSSCEIAEKEIDGINENTESIKHIAKNYNMHFEIIHE